MYKLYNVRTWGSLAIHCLLEEMGAPYTNIWMTPEQVREPEFRAISPLGLVPALGLADGRTLFESAAIVAFLVTAHPDRHMSPEPGSADFGEFLTLLNLMSAEIYGISNFSYSAGDYVKDEAAQQSIKARVRQQVDGSWSLIEQRLEGGGPWLMGKAFSAVDIYAFMMSIWGAPSEQALLDRCPAVARLAAGVRARPKLKAVLESHGVLKVGGFAG